MVPLIDLKAQYKAIGSAVEEAVLRVLKSGEYILGSEVQAFEKEFAAFCGGGEAVAVNSGTSALHAALLSAGVSAGDEVITVPMTFIATASAIDYTGAKPVFVDVDPATWTMDPAKVEAAITKRTKAIFPVHLHGRVADMDPLVEIGRRHNLMVIEDAAQAHGAIYKGRRAGSIGDMACFSFYAGKNLGACGEGGAVVSANARFVERIRLLRDWGAEQKYHHIIKGFNYRMENIQGAILRIKLRRLEEWTQARQTFVSMYDEQIDALGIDRPKTPDPGDRHAYHIYAVRVADRDQVRSRMVDEGIGVGLHYPIPVHLQPAFAELGYARGDFPVSERIAAETLSLPLFPEMTAKQHQRVCLALERAVRSAA